MDHFWGDVVLIVYLWNIEKVATQLYSHTYIYLKFICYSLLKQQRQIKTRYTFVVFYNDMIKYHSDLSGLHLIVKNVVTFSQGVILIYFLTFLSAQERAPEAGLLMSR